MIYINSTTTVEDWGSLGEQVERVKCRRVERWKGQLWVRSDGISFGIGASALLDSRHQPTQLNLRFAGRSSFGRISPFQSPLFSCRW